MLRIGDRVWTPDGFGYVRSWGMHSETGRMVRTSRKRALASSEAWVLVWHPVPEMAGQDPQQWHPLWRVKAVASPLLTAPLDNFSMAV